MTKDEIIAEMRKAYQETKPGAGGYPAMGDRIIAAMEVLAGIVADTPKKKRVVKKK